MRCNGSVWLLTCTGLCFRSKYCVYAKPTEQGIVTLHFGVLSVFLQFIQCVTAMYFYIAGTASVEKYCCTSSSLLKSSKPFAISSSDGDAI